MGAEMILAAVTSENAARAGWAVLATIVLVILCALFLLAVILLALGRRRRRLAAESAQRAQSAGEVDPWQEAGRRLTMPDD